MVNKVFEVYSHSGTTSIFYVPFSSDFKLNPILVYFLACRANKDPFLGVRKRLNQSGAELGQAQPELCLKLV